MKSSGSVGRTAQKSLMATLSAASSSVRWVSTTSRGVVRRLDAATFMAKRTAVDLTERYQMSFQRRA